jgi:L-serine dehydratase
MEECISVFDMLKIGVGPSSSHTLGPWQERTFSGRVEKKNLIQSVIRVKLIYMAILNRNRHATDL